MKAKNMIAAVAMLLFSSLAFAGLFQPFSVEVLLNPDGSGSASGDMAAARFSDNDVEYIGCGVRMFEDGAGGFLPYAFCQAADSADVRGFCSTENAGLVEALRAPADYSFITFAWDAAGVCTYVGSSTQSFYIPDNAVAAKKGRKK